MGLNARETEYDSSTEGSQSNGHHLHQLISHPDMWMFADEAKCHWTGKEKVIMTAEEMQQLLIGSVEQSTTEVFGTMLGLQLEPGEIYSTSGSPAPTEGVVSLIGLAGPWMGTGSLSCNPQLACKISGALLMGEYAGVDEEVLDAFAEVTNMVVGNVKTLLEERVGSMGLSIPTVIFGRNFSTKSAGGNWTVIPFTCNGEKLLVQVCLVKSTENHTMSRVGFTNPQYAGVK